MFACGPHVHQGLSASNQASAFRRPAVWCGVGVEVDELLLFANASVGASFEFYLTSYLADAAGFILNIQGRWLI